MDVAFSHLSWWFWKGKQNQEPRISKGSHKNSSTDSVMREMDVLRYPLVINANEPSSSTKRVKRKWQSRKEREILDREYDVVIVPSDDGCVSGSESDASDWSIGWLEPHGIGFANDDDDDEGRHETDNSFAVLVPCYGRSYSAMVEDNAKSNILSNIGYFQDSYSDESKKYVENWITSLRHT